MEDLDSTISLASAPGSVWWFGTRYFQIACRLARSCPLPSPWSPFWAWRAEQSPARYDAHGILEPHQDQEIFGSDSGWNENTKFASESATSVLRSLQRQHQMQAHQVLQGASNLVPVDEIQIVEPHGGLGVDFQRARLESITFIAISQGCPEDVRDNWLLDSSMTRVDRTKIIRTSIS